jgi:mono/diheme cytochrome c family protein
MGDGHKKPSLRTERIKSATDGDLEWFIRQGDLSHGMPSWSRLPEAQRWQLVAYLRSIQ